MAALHLPFSQLALPPALAPTFDELAEGVSFERVGRGRSVAVLFRELGESRVPIVRTTARYNEPSRPFTRHVGALADAISAACGLPVAFNNAMAEVYGRDYRTMGFHSDMALDLDAASHIAIYSVYDTPPPPDAIRDLIVKDKATGADTVLPLAPNTVTLFSVRDNARFLHKIVLRAPPSLAADRVQWLGITLRTSKTTVQFGCEPGPPHFLHDATCATDAGPLRLPLTLASPAQARELYALRQEENRADAGFAYPPDLWHTLSPSDAMCPWSERR